MAPVGLVPWPSWICWNRRVYGSAGAVRVGAGVHAEPGAGAVLAQHGDRGVLQQHVAGHAVEVQPGACCSTVVVPTVVGPGRPLTSSALLPFSPRLRFSMVVRVSAPEVSVMPAPRQITPSAVKNHAFLRGQRAGLRDEVQAVRAMPLVEADAAGPGVAGWWFGAERGRGAVGLGGAGDRGGVDGRPVGVGVVALVAGQERVERAVADVPAVQVLAVDRLVAADPGRGQAERRRPVAGHVHHPVGLREALVHRR